MTTITMDMDHLHSIIREEVEKCRFAPSCKKCEVEEDSSVSIQLEKAKETIAYLQKFAQEQEACINRLNKKCEAYRNIVLDAAVDLENFENNYLEHEDNDE